jgi:hypothetical protein
VYSLIFARGVPIYTNYSVKILGLFMKQLKKKRPAWWPSSGGFTGTMPLCILRWWSRSGWQPTSVQVICHPLYSPDMAQADVFLFRRVREQLAGLTLDQHMIKKTWEGVTRAIAPDEFTTAFQLWYERCQKCIEIYGDDVEKS